FLVHHHLFDFSLYLPPSVLTSISTLSLHDALPIFSSGISKRAIFSSNFSIKSRMLILSCSSRCAFMAALKNSALVIPGISLGYRSEEHTSELQSRFDLVCRLLLEKKNKNNRMNT